MGYIEDSLVPGEQVLYKAKISMLAFITPVLLLALLWYIAAQVHQLLVFFVFLFSLYVLVRLLVVVISTEFALTNKRIIAKTRLIRRQSLEIMLSKLESITVSQSLDGRIWGYGTVVVVGSGGTRQPFRLISKPMELRKRVNAQISLAV
jgi:uncharacterized membrane protein YdbT with pleckstrin-like domain